MGDRSIWPEVTLEPLLRDFLILCVQRGDDQLEKLLQVEGSLLNKYRERIHVVGDPIENSISSSAVRKLIAEGRSVRYIVPDGVLDYIYGNQLY